MNTQLQQILASEIFGAINPSETADIAKDNQTAQITSLPYTLKGIISGTTASSGGAIIEISPGDSRYFSQGREISANITLQEVNPDHIVISNQGRKEILRLTDLSLSMASVTTIPGASFNSANNPAMALPPTSANNRDSSESSSPENTMDSEDIINRDRIRQRLEELRARNPS